MKWIRSFSTALVLSLSLVCSSSLYAEMGSILITKSTYFYKAAKKDSKRILTRRKQALHVIGMNIDPNNVVYYQVEVPSTTNKVNGTGYIVETQEELQDSPQQKIKIYPELPRIKGDLTHFVQVESSKLIPSGRVEKSKDFPNLHFTQVSYKSVIPRTYWVPEWAGIYRPDKGAKWLNTAYSKLRRMKISKAKRNKILMGLIETGFKMEEVRLGMGDPVKVEENVEKKQTTWIYDDRRIIFQAGKVSQLL